METCLQKQFTRDYLFIICNITNNTEPSVKEGISFYDMDNFIPMPILDENGLNKTRIDYTIFEYIYKDQNNQLQSPQDFVFKTINSVYNWFLKFTKEAFNQISNN